MSTLSVPLTPQLEKQVEDLVAQGYASNKAEVMRKALKKAAEDEAVRHILEASREVKDGIYFEGDLREILKKFPN